MRSTIVLFLVVLAGCTKLPPDPLTPLPPSPDEPRSARLEIAVRSLVENVSLGQRLNILLDVTNTGAGPAVAIAPLPIMSSGNGGLRQIDAAQPLSADLQPGQRQTFALVLEAVELGRAGLAFSAEGTDVAARSAVVSASVNALIQVQAPPLLSVESIRGARAVNTSQTLELEVDVFNGGEVAAEDVELAVEGTGSSISLTSLGSDRLTVAPGASEKLKVRLQGAAVGIATFNVIARGADLNSGEPVESVPSSADPVAIDSPARLTATLELPTTAIVGQRVMATLTIRNTGSAVARSVLPTTLTLTGSGGASVSGVSPSAIDIAGGGEADFQWPLVLNRAGTVVVATSARGLDANSGAAVSLASLSSLPTTVLVASALSVESFVGPVAINRGQLFEVSLVVRNSGTSEASGVQVDPSQPVQTRVEGASAVLLATPAPQRIAPGSTATFTLSFRENGTGLGALYFSAGARGVDATSNQVVEARAVATGAISVRTLPQLLVTAVTLPAKLNSGQTFSARVTVRNFGGTEANAVAPTLTFRTSPTGLASAVATAVAAPIGLASGASFEFTIPCRESGAGSGLLFASAVARGTNPRLNDAVVSPARENAPGTQVQRPAELVVTNMTVPSTVSRGRQFVLGMVVSNSGEAEARNVVPTPLIPVAVSSGMARAMSATSAVALTVPGQASRTFTWVYTETGSGEGTLAFRAGATGRDANDNRPLTASAISSNASAVDSTATCNGSVAYSGVSGERLDADRLVLPAGSDRLRLKPYSTLQTEYTRLLGVRPPAIVNQQATFDVQPARWSAEQELSAVSVGWAFVAAHQACTTLTTMAAPFGVDPTAGTAQAQCQAWQRTFWAAEPSPHETAECVRFTLSAQNVGLPRARWAAACAAVATAAGFLSH